VTTADIAAMTLTQLGAWTAAGTSHALTSAQIGAITFHEIRRLPALTSDQVTSGTEKVSNEATLRERVNSLVQAISSFESEATTIKATAGMHIPSAGASEGGALAVTSNVGNIVDAMKRFDANGNLIERPGDVASTNEKLSLTNLHVDGHNGFLGTPRK